MEVPPWMGSEENWHSRRVVNLSAIVILIGPFWRIRPFWMRVVRWMSLPCYDIPSNEQQVTFYRPKFGCPNCVTTHKNLTLGDYLRDTNLLLSTRTIWVDGQAGVLWLTGTHTEDWVVPHLNASELSRRQELYTNHTAELCLLAADRLDQTLWFGILEHVNKSMAVLQHALGLDETPVLPRGNLNPKHAAAQPRVLSAWERQAMASLVPMDLWLYEYGKRLLDARFAAIQTGLFVPPQRPPMPKVWSCVSTTKSLDCVKGPLQGSHRWTKRRQSSMLMVKKNGGNNVEWQD